MYNWSGAQKKIKDSSPLPTQWTCNWESGRSPYCFGIWKFWGKGVKASVSFVLLQVGVVFLFYFFVFELKAFISGEE